MPGCRKRGRRGARQRGIEYAGIVTGRPDTPPRTIAWATGLVSSRSIELLGGEIVVTDRRLGRNRIRRIASDHLDPTPVPLQRTSRLLLGLVVFSLGVTISSLVDWNSRFIVTDPLALIRAAAWAAVTALLTIHYVRSCGRFLVWSFAVSRRPALEIPARLADRIDIAAFLRVPTLHAAGEAAVAGTTHDRLQQLDFLLKKGHISDAEYLLLKQKAMHDHRNAPEFPS